MSTHSVMATRTTTVEHPDTPLVTHPIDAEVDMELLKVVPKHFEIVDEASANWLVRRVISAREYSEHVKLFAERERRRAEREETTLMILFGRGLERWVKEQVQKLNGRRKSIVLPAGTVGHKTINPSLQIDDELLVINWAKKNLPSAVVITEKLSRSILSDHYKTTGEIPDRGAHVEPERESFGIR